MPFFLMSGDEVFLGKWVWVIFFEWVSSDRFPFWGNPGISNKNPVESTELSSGESDKKLLDMFGDHRVR